MITLGIETSCDDTSICLLETQNDEQLPKVLIHQSFSQELLLQKWGGVVPEVAARNHLSKLAPLLEQVFSEAKIKIEDVSQIGVTTHPGLLGPLLTGLNAAKTISLINKAPINPVNHLFAHLEAIHLTEKVSYPYLGLLFSGGHSLFARVSSPTKFKVLSSTLDDAAGEAFDKGGKILGLEYPAGRIIDQLSQKGDRNRFSFPIGLKGSKDGKMSFSGVKTSLKTFVEKNKDNLKDPKFLQDTCASYQEAIVQAIKEKTIEVLNLNHELRKSPVVLGGGVACNSRLREVLTESVEHLNCVKPAYCTDNGAMIANYAARTVNNNIAYPDCLKLDARSRYLS